MHYCRYKIHVQCETPPCSVFRSPNYPLQIRIFSFISISQHRSGTITTVMLMRREWKLFSDNSSAYCVVGQKRRVFADCEFFVLWESTYVRVELRSMWMEFTEIFCISANNMISIRHQTSISIKLEYLPVRNDVNQSRGHEEGLVWI